MFSITHHPKQNINTLYKECKESLNAENELFSEQSSFDIAQLYTNSEELQKIITLYNNCFNFFVSSHFRKFLDSHYLLEKDFHSFKEKFEKQSSDSFLFQNKKDNFIFRFSKKTKTYTCLIYIWQFFLPTLPTFFLVDYLDDKRTELKNIIGGFHANRVNVEKIQNISHKNFFYFRFLVKDTIFCLVEALFGRQILFNNLKSLEDFSFFVFADFQLILSLDFAIVQLLEILFEYIQTMEEVSLLYLSKNNKNL